MKTIKTFSLIVAASLIVSSCTTYGQFGAGMAGASLGSHLGRDIGYLAGGHHYHFSGRSAALGSLIGAGVGAALGVSIHNGIEQARERRYERAQNQQNYQNNQYGNQNQYQNYGTSSDDYQTGGGSGYGSSNGSSSNGSSSCSSRPSYSNAYVTVESISYMDGNGDGYLSKNETIEIDTYITNTTSAPLNNVTISIVSNDTRNVTLSSPLVTSLAPGQKVHYTGRVYCQKVKKNAPISVSVNVLTNGANCNTGSISIYMK